MPPPPRSLLASCRIPGLSSFGFWVLGLGFGVWGFGFRVYGLRLAKNPALGVMGIEII